MMQLQIQSPTMNGSPALREFVELRIKYLMASIRRHVRKCRVILSDIIGPLGKRSKQCQLVLALDTQDEIVIEGMHDDIYDAINAALHKACRVVQKRLNRKVA